MKIEEGCLAIVINSYTPSNIGKCVTVLKYVGEVCRFEYKDLWAVSEPMTTNLGNKEYYQREVNLMRIDGIKDSETTKIAETVQ